MKQFVLRCENAVKACDKIDPQIEEGKWYEIKKKTQQNLQAKCHIYQYQAGTHFHQTPYQTF